MGVATMANFKKPTLFVRPCCHSILRTLKPVFCLSTSTDSLYFRIAQVRKIWRFFVGDNNNDDTTDYFTHCACAQDNNIGKKVLKMLQSCIYPVFSDLLSCIQLNQAAKSSVLFRLWTVETSLMMDSASILMSVSPTVLALSVAMLYYHACTCLCLRPCPCYNWILSLNQTLSWHKNIFPL